MQWGVAEPDHPPVPHGFVRTETVGIRASECVVRWVAESQEDIDNICHLCTRSAGETTGIPI